jgi:hypothetical protein
MQCVIDWSTWVEHLWESRDSDPSSERLHHINEKLSLPDGPGKGIVFEMWIIPTIKVSLQKKEEQKQKWVSFDFSISMPWDHKKYNQNCHQFRSPCKHIHGGKVGKQCTSLERKEISMGYGAGCWNAVGRGGMFARTGLFIKHYRFHRALSPGLKNPSAKRRDWCTHCGVDQAFKPTCANLCRWERGLVRLAWLMDHKTSKNQGDTHDGQQYSVLLFPLNWPTISC